jgi:glycosyltransferase involved in cell wall biosynthesis
MENYVYKSGNIISINSPGFINNLKSKGVPSEKMEVVTDWADENKFFPISYDHQLAARFHLAGKFNVIYAGNIGKLQGLEVVIEAAQRIKEIAAIQFVLIGDGTELDKLKSLKATYRLRNILFIPRQPFDEIHRFLAIADVLLVHLNSDPVFEMQLPSKIIAYMACGRPVLCAMHGEARKMVEKARAGLFCPSGDPDALCDAVQKFYDMPRSKREEMAKNGRGAYLDNYTRQIQVDRVEKLLLCAAGAC